MKPAKSVVARLFEHAGSRPDAVAVICGDDRVTYAKLAEGVRAFTSRLQQLGVKPSDRIVLSASSTANFIYGYFGTHLAGAVAVPVDPQIAGSRLAYICEQTKPGAAFLNRPYETSLTRVLSIDDLQLSSQTEVDFALPQPSGTGDILFTTGTTGHPKGVVLSHRNILAAATNINEFIGNGPDDSEVVPLPLSHSFGLGRLRCNMLAGGTLILSPGFASPGPLFKLLQGHRATGFSFVPAGWAILHRLTRDKLGECADHLKYIEIGSAPMPLELKQILMRLLPATRICHHYGLTEASRSSFIELHESADHLDSIGKAAPNVQIDIVDDNGRIVPEGEVGEIVVRGGMVMESYWNSPELTSEVCVWGGVRTGDVGYRDSKGYVYLRGRKSEIINGGGLKVSPVDVDHALSQHPAIADCACVGVPDPNGLTGDAVKAFVVTEASYERPDRVELIEFLRTKLEPHEVPLIYEWVDAIPKTGSGKVLRGQLAEKHEA